MSSSRSTATTGAGSERPSSPAWDHRETIGAYGVLDTERNVAYRSSFVVDRDGALRWGQSGDRQMVRDGAEVLRVLDVIERLRRPA